MRHQDPMYGAPSLRGPAPAHIGYSHPAIRTLAARHYLGHPMSALARTLSLRS